MNRRTFLAALTALVVAPVATLKGKAADLTSLWLVSWGEKTVHTIGQAGFKSNPIDPRLIRVATPLPKTYWRALNEGLPEYYVYSGGGQRPEEFTGLVRNELLDDLKYLEAE